MMSALSSYIAADYGIAESQLAGYTGLIRPGALPAFLLVPLADRPDAAACSCRGRGHRGAADLATAFAPTVAAFVAGADAGAHPAWWRRRWRSIVAEEFPAEHRGWGIGMGAGGARRGFWLRRDPVRLRRAPAGKWRALYAVGVFPLFVMPRLRRGIRETRRFDHHRAQNIGDGGIGGVRGWSAPLAGLARSYPRRVAGVTPAGALYLHGRETGVFQFCGYFTLNTHHWEPWRFSLMAVVAGAVGMLGNRVVAGRLGDPSSGAVRSVSRSRRASPGLAWLFYHLPGFWPPLLGVPHRLLGVLQRHDPRARDRGLPDPHRGIVGAAGCRSCRPSGLRPARRRRPRHRGRRDAADDGEHAAVLTIVAVRRFSCCPRPAARARADQQRRRVAAIRRGGGPRRRRSGRPERAVHVLEAGVAPAELLVERRETVRRHALERRREVAAETPDARTDAIHGRGWRTPPRAARAPARRSRTRRPARAHRARARTAQLRAVVEVVASAETTTSRRGGSAKSRGRRARSGSGPGSSAKRCFATFEHLLRDVHEHEARAETRASCCDTRPVPRAEVEHREFVGWTLDERRDRAVERVEARDQLPARAVVDRRRAIEQRTRMRVGGRRLRCIGFRLACGRLPRKGRVTDCTGVRRISDACRAPQTILRACGSTSRIFAFTGARRRVAGAFARDAERRERRRPAQPHRAIVPAERTQRVDQERAPRDRCRTRSGARERQRRHVHVRCARAPSSCATTVSGGRPPSTLRKRRENDPSAANCAITCRSPDHSSSRPPRRAT